MRTQSILLLAASLFLTATAAPITSTEAVTDASAAKSTVLTSISFGADPLEYQSSGGNENITSVIYDPANAKTGNGYLLYQFPDVPDKRYVVQVFGFHMKTNHVYTATYFAKQGKQDAQCYAMVGIRDNAENVIGLTDNVALTKKYQKFTQTVSTPADLPKNDVGVAYYSVTCTGSGASAVYVDDFVVTEASA